MTINTLRFVVFLSLAIGCICFLLGATPLQTIAAVVAVVSLLVAVGSAMLVYEERHHDEPR